MNIFKKMLSIMLVFAILLPNLFTVSATQTKSHLSQSERWCLIDALSDVDLCKASWGLEHVDFGKLNIGEPVQTYNYVGGKFEKGQEMYPLTIDNELILWAIPSGNQFQITNGLVDEVNKAIDPDDAVALVYDKNSAYIYSNESFTLVNRFNQTVESRDVLNTKTRTSEQEINTVLLTQNTPLNYEESIVNARETRSTYVTCNVSYITQHPYENLCWAASVACIVNYVKGTSLNAVTVARKYYGSTNFDRAIDRDELTSKIRGYGLNYYQFGDEGFDNKILNSLSEGCPVGAAFDVIEGGYHACVIYGINVIAGRIQVMDPEFGLTTAIYSSGTYTYVSSYSNATLELYAISYDTGE